MFDDPEHDILFRWTSVMNEEAKNSSGMISKQRPDGAVSKLDGRFFGSTLGYIEVKSIKESHNKYAISKDLARIGILSKNALDVTGNLGCLGIQVNGLNMNFYITTLLSDGLYVMFEICTIDIPSSLQSLQGFLGYLDELLIILDCFDNWCVPESTMPIQKTSRKRKTLDDMGFDIILSRSKNNKRRCYTS
ncbi:hypothetical protein INT45_006476 [Circinella minor]|uniref:Uncharacterized protein n=1 Tax=Circinella minor TaxID=1195481 RepID=A0A8H7VB93_9FUNG|nr:hypothetical protein INT45_006476 [Circinella minor]